MTSHAGDAGTRILSVLVAGLLFSSTQASAQQSLTRDPATGDYVLSYNDVYGQTHSLPVQALDRIAPKLDVTVGPLGGGFRYTYRLTNQISPNALGGRGVTQVSIRCPDTDPGLQLLAPAGWSGVVVKPVGGTVCTLGTDFRTPVVDPGQSLDSLGIQSAWLTGIVDSKIFGDIGDVAALPTSIDEADSGDVVDSLLNRAQGYGFFDGGGVLLKTVGPARPASAFAPPRAGVLLILADLNQACEPSLLWIDQASTCTSLRNKLNAAATALQQGQTATARTQLTAFNSQLTEQLGLHVNQNAYYLLKTNTDYVLSRL